MTRLMEAQVMWCCEEGHDNYTTLYIDYEWTRDASLLNDIQPCHELNCVVCDQAAAMIHASVTDEPCHLCESVHRDILSVRHPKLK